MGVELGRLAHLLKTDEWVTYVQFGTSKEEMLIKEQNKISRI